MRHYSRVFLLPLSACLISAAQAQGASLQLAGLSDGQWSVVSAVLGACLAISLVFLIGSVFKAARLRRRVASLEHEISQFGKTETILKEAHEELEVRVRDRTADLEMSYQKLNDVRDSLAAANDRLESVARIDGLTGVANRPQFDEMVHKEIKRSLRSRKPLSLMLVELDDFVSYRRQYGRDRADETLRKAAVELEKTFRRAPDIVARYDDHSFGVIMPETEVRDAMRFAERLRQIVYQLCVPYPESEIADRVTASVGLSTMQPDKLYDASDFIKAAQSALRAAHAAGCNTVEYGVIRAEAEAQTA